MKKRKPKATPKLVSTIRDYLEQLGYSNIELDGIGQLRIPGSFGNATFLVVVRVLDKETAEFRAAYYSHPQGEAEAIVEWQKRLGKRAWGMANLNLVECPEGDVIIVRGHFRAVDTPKGNKGLLYYLMYCMREYFRCWKDDADYADTLGLKFREVDVSRPFCSES